MVYWQLLYLLSSILFAAAERRKYGFNAGWKVEVSDVINAESADFNDTNWKNVTTPHAWNENDAFRVPIANLSTGVAWYRKHFQIPDNARDQKVFLEFEGIRFGGDFYINGQFIGRHENGVMAFGFDISDSVLPGQDNIVAARISNSWEYREVSTNQRYQWNDRNFYANYGGINKNVYLHTTDKLHQTLPLYSNLNTTGVYVYAQDIDVERKSATIATEAQIKNGHSERRVFSYQATVSNSDGRVLGTLSGKELTIQPNETLIASASGSISGLNFWSWGYGYLYTVRTSIIEEGTAIDTVITQTGFRKTDFSNGMFTLNDRTLQLKGYAQRSTNEWPALGSSIPAWLSDFSNKLMLDSNANLVRWMHVTPWKQDVESCDRLGIMQELPAGDSEADVTGRRWEHRTTLMRDAIIYNRNNPSVIFYESGNFEISEDHMLEMKAIRDTYDPHGGRAIGSREMLASAVAEFGGEMLYINKGVRIPFFAHEYSRDEGLRKYWDDHSPPFHRDGEGPLYNGDDASAYNRNQDSHAIENVARWVEYYENRPGTGERVSAGGVNIIFSDSNTHERGAENYRRSGEVDAVRIPKDAWHAHRIMWNNWVDADVPAAHIIGHWNYNSTIVKNLTVISTTEKVELFVNGKSKGTGEPSSYFLHTFADIAWETGTLRAVGFDAAGKEVTSDERITAGPPAALRLTSHISPGRGWIADGADIALVDVEVVDSAGQRDPIALDNISFTLSGAAEWRGGLAQGRDDNYILANTLPVQGGINRVVLRSTTTDGSVQLRAKAEGLSSASIELTTKPVEVENGLTDIVAGQDLSPFLARGPTPEGQSFRMTTTPLDIVAASAGSANSSANVSNSYDDNEETTWVSSTATRDAWVSYDLGKESAVNRVVMKLQNWKSERYPLNMSIDGEVVWSGTTPLTLGYAQLQFEETRGQNVTIASRSGDFGIVEVEIYGPPT